SRNENYITRFQLRDVLNAWVSGYHFVVAELRADLAITADDGHIGWVSSFLKPACQRHCLKNINLLLRSDCSRLHYFASYKFSIVLNGRYDNSHIADSGE